MATLNSVMTKLRNLLSSLNTKTGRSDTTFNAAISALPSKKTDSNVSVSGKTVTTPAGIYFSQVQKSVATGSISGGADVISQNLTASASSDKLTLTASSTAPSSDYISVTAGGSVTLAPYANCSTAGYVSSGVVGGGEYDESLTNTTKYYKISKVGRADTSLTSAKSNNTLVFTAENNQAAGYGDGGKKTATKTVSLSASGATVTASDGTNSISTTIASGSCTVSGGGLSVTNNYSGTPTVDITLDGQTTSGATITDTKPSSGYYLTLGASSSALSGTTKVTRANITDTHTAGYIPAKSATTVISSTTASPTVTVNKGTKTEYVTIPTATFSTSGKTVKSSTAGYVPANTNVGTVSDSYIIPSGTKTISSSGTHNVTSYASASVAAGSVSSPSITVNSSGVISASATKTAGYITAGTASNTKNAKDLDSNLVASNIKKNIKILGVTGSYEGGATVNTCTVKLGIDTMDWYAKNNVRVFYTSYSSGAFNTNVVQTNASTTSTITLSNVVCGSSISVWTQVYAYISPSTYTKYTDEYNHCFMCPNSPGQTITIDLLENS